MKGLCNAGLTCYFNAALQFLGYCPNLTNYFLSGAEAGCTTRSKLACAVAAEYADFVRAYWAKEGGHPMDPSPLRAAFVRACKQFKPGAQHDAHEAVECLLQKLHEALSHMKPGAASVTMCPGVDKGAWVAHLANKASVVSEVLVGQVRVSVEGKGYSCVTHDHFTCLTLAINAATSLTQCIQRHMAPERLEDYRVDGALMPVDVSKNFTYLPRVLLVHLKRFDNNGAKIDKFINYPAELDLSEYTDPGCPPHFQLFAVCLHRGTATNGHYTACGEVKGNWFSMDDEAVTPMRDINDIIQRDAYMLAYKRLT